MIGIGNIIDISSIEHASAKTGDRLCAALRQIIKGRRIETHRFVRADAAAAQASLVVPLRQGDELIAGRAAGRIDAAACIVRPNRLSNTKLYDKVAFCLMESI